MNSEDKNKTPDRRSGEGASSEADHAEKMPEFGGSASPGGAGAGDAVAGELLAAEAPETRGRGAPKKPARARKDHLREYAASLGREPGELLLETIFEGFQAHIDDGGTVGEFLEYRAARMAARLGMKAKDAMALLSKLLGDAMPYTHQKLPTAIEMEGGQIMFAMVMPDGSIQEGAAGGPGGLDLRPADERKPALINDKSDTKSDTDSRTEGGESQ